MTKDITGQRFGLLVAVEPTEQRKNGCVVWKCECDCGNDAYIPVRSLLCGNTKSCGCTRGGRVVVAVKQRYEQLEQVARDLYGLSISLMECIAKIIESEDAEERAWAAYGAVSGGGHVLEHAEEQFKELGVDISAK